MQHSRFPTLKRHAAAAVALELLALLAGAGARAAELGDATVRSFIGQPLVADIELTALAPDEAGKLQVRLATPDVYRGANIAMNPALQSLSVSVLRRDQRQFLHLTTMRRIEAQYVHLFLELSAGERSMVRAATVWLTPDPAPAPATMPSLAPAAVPAPAPAPLPARRAAPEPEPEPEMGAASNPMLAASLRQAASVSMPHRRSEAKVCGAQGAAGEQARECIALDRKNAALSSKLVELEGKVKVLQKELAQKPAGAPQAAAARPDSIAPEPVKALVPLKPVPLKALKKTAPAARKNSESTSTPVMLLAGGATLLLLAIGLAVYAFRRRKKDQTDSAPSKYWVLLRNPFRRKKAAEAPPPEPAAEAAYTPVAEAVIE